MTTITSKNLLDFLRAYFASLGLGTEADEYFTAKNFAEGLVLKLPAVCLVPGNKPNSSRSKQTHIHVTGNNRYFFYKADDVDSAVASTDDYQYPLLVSTQNIKALNNEAITEPGLCFDASFTLTKIACRASQESQVQISKLRQDGARFIQLRNSLYEGDLLIFLKQRIQEALLVVGIPKGFYQGNYEFASDIYSGLESKGTVTVKNALSVVMTEYGDTDVVNSDDAISDVVYQEMVNESDGLNAATFYEPIAYVPTKQEALSKSSRPSTNPALGKDAIRRNRYLCAADPNHPTFIKKNGERYMEAHHLIPLEWQSEFDNKLDTSANLVSLCPLCHKLIHYGRPEDKNPILAKLFEERYEPLQKSGLEISQEALLRFYE